MTLLENMVGVICQHHHPSACSDTVCHHYHWTPPLSLCVWVCVTELCMIVTEGEYIIKRIFSVLRPNWNGGGVDLPHKHMLCVRANSQ